MAGRIRDESIQAVRERAAIDQVIMEAGVALKTVYLAFGTKAGVLHGLWDVRLGGDDQPTVSRDRGTTTREKTDRSSTSARQSAKAGTYLKQAEAAEASEPPNMGPDEILAYYIRKAQAEARVT